MTGRRLPDDPAEWPDDPYELLGVPRDIEARGLRRAYAQLIRRYKPEHAPAEFQRIRAAYERLHGAEGTPPRFVVDFPAAERAAVDDSDEAAPTEQHASDPLPEVPESDAAEDEAVPAPPPFGDDPAEAYRTLLDRREARPADAETVLRSYWMLKLRPDLDDEREPADWLAEACVRRPVPRLLAVYRDEVDANRSEALRPRFERLLDAEIPLHWLTVLLELRWQSAMGSDEGPPAPEGMRPAVVPPGEKLGHDEANRLIGRDLKRYRERFLRADAAAWIRLLLSAMDHVAWLHDEHVARWCWEELQSFPELAIPFSNAFDRLERLLEFAQLDAASVEGTTWEPIILLMRDGWARPFEELRPRLLELFGEWDRNPADAMKQLDAIETFHGERLLMQLSMQLSEWIQRLDPMTFFDCEIDSEATAAIEACLLGTADDAYPVARKRIRDFCLREAIPLDAVIRVLDRLVWMHEEDRAEFSRMLSRDLPLHCVLDGCRVFRAV